VALVEERVNRLVQLNLEYQEEFATKFMDQIVGVILKLRVFGANRTGRRVAMTKNTVMN